MSETQLPAVAKNVYTDCKKCEAERYHRVLAHVSSVSAKVQCEVCGAKKTYKLPSAVKRKSASGAPRAPSSKKAELLASQHREQYDSLMSQSSDGPVPYKMTIKFATNQKLEHPKFGLGIVRAIQSDKIEVIFPDQVRLLVHNRM